METVNVDAEPAERDSPWLTPGVRGIGTASLLADLGHEVPTALLPSFLTSTLGPPAAALGAIEGVSDGLAGACRFFETRSGHAFSRPAEFGSAPMGRGGFEPPSDGL